MNSNFIQQKNINRIVIWGLRKKYHTHRYIHQAFFNNAKKLGYDVIWVEDDKKNAQMVKSGDLIISAEVVGRMVPEKNKIEDYNLPIVDGAYYCLHNYKDLFKKQINSANLLNLSVYENKAEKADIKIGPVTYFNTKTRTLFQPWGTNLLESEFLKPVFNKNKFVFWVGSIWNDKNNHGNLQQIDVLKSALLKNNLKFVNIRFVPDWMNKFFVRKSRIAPAISGDFQVDINYLPCRMFKNISYGQLGFSNVKKFKEIFKEYNVDGTIDEMIDKVLKLSKEEYKNLVLKQQEIVKDFTYKQSLENIIESFSRF